MTSKAITPLLMDRQSERRTALVGVFSTALLLVTYTVFVFISAQCAYFSKITESLGNKISP